MSKVRVASFSMSIDGYGAGPNQDLANPLGVGGTALHEWAFATRTYHRMLGQEGLSSGVDEDFAARGFENVGAWVLGRNMFGPIRAPWQDGAWKGWWGDDPPYHSPVFVLTHHARPSLEMAGGIHVALQAARAAAAGRDVRIGGGVATIRDYLRAGLIDELHIAISPLMLGAGENVFANIDVPKLGYHCVEHKPTPSATHVVLSKHGTDRG